MKKINILIVLTALTLIGCTEDNLVVPQSVKQKTGCVCSDGSVIIWRNDLMKQTSWLTGNPCQTKGGIKEYLYGN